MPLRSCGLRSPNTTPRSRDIMRPSFAKFVRPKKIEGAGKTGCALHPRSHVQKAYKKTHMSIQVQRKQSGLPCAMVLRLISCSPRRDLARLPPSPPKKRASQELDTSHWGVRTTRLRRPRQCRSSCGTFASIAPRAQRSRRWPTPLLPVRDGVRCEGDLPLRSTMIRCDTLARRANQQMLSRLI